MESEERKEIVNYSKDNKIKFHWNPLTQQPNITYSRWQRNLEYLRYGKDHLQMLWFSIKLFPKLFSNYLKLLNSGEMNPKLIEKGFCVGTDNNPSRFEKILEEIKELGICSVLLRIPVWDLENLNHCRDFLIEIKNLGIEPIISILQDYNSTVDLNYWKNGLEKIFNALYGLSFYYGIGHAWNRYKWGVKSFKQYLDLVEKAEELRKDYTEARFFGPSVIDFEYICTMGVLNHPKRKPKFEVVNALLYVDRQGAPESKHMGFDLSKKSLLMRAIINSVYGEQTPLWVTETNWPLKAKSEYVPTSLKESVDEETYADYLVRYYLLALSSGAEKVYWWQLAAHGYGIIDDLDKKWIRRPAWYAFKTMSKILGSFRLKNKRIKKSLYSFTFERADGKLITVAWSLKKKQTLPIEFDVEEAISRDGKPIKISDSVIVGPSPVYLIHRKI